MHADICAHIHTNTCALVSHTDIYTCVYTHVHAHTFTHRHMHFNKTGNIRDLRMSTSSDCAFRNTPNLFVPYNLLIQIKFNDIVQQFYLPKMGKLVFSIERHSWKLIVLLPFI